MYYINPYIKDLYRSKFNEDRSGVLRLDMNENPEGLPVDFVESVKKKITPELIATYPLKDSLTSKLSKHNGVDTECITVTSGSDEAMRLIFECFGCESKALVTAFPTFEMYGIYAKMTGMEHVTASFDENLKISAEAISELIDSNTSIVVLLNPNSPIGTTFSDTEARGIIEKAAKNNAVVIIDEAYHYFYKNTFVPLIEEYDNLIVLRTFSKLFSMAGLRIGYAVSNKQIINYIENSQATFNVNNIALLFASEMLDRPDIIENLRIIESEGHQWIYERLCENGYNVLQAYGNFMLFKTKRPSSEIVAELKEKNIFTRDYSKGVLSGFLRITTGSHKCMEQFLNALLEIDHL